MGTRVSVAYLSMISFDSLVFELFAGFEATLEAAKFGDVKAETTEAVQLVIGQCSRSDGIREWWTSVGNIKFAKDFAGEVDRLADEARAADPSAQTLLPFLLPPATSVAADQVSAADDSSPD